MAKEEKEKKGGEAERGGSEKKAPKKHLHSLRLELTRDHTGKATGVVEHHTYKTKPTDHHTEPEKPVAVHNTPEEASESVQDNLAQAMGGAGAQGGEPEGGEEGAPPDAGGAAPAAGM